LFCGSDQKDLDFRSKRRNSLIVAVMKKQPKQDAFHAKVSGKDRQIGWPRLRI
jgi:hypothetical protein